MDMSWSQGTLEQPLSSLCKDSVCILRFCKLKIQTAGIQTAYLANERENTTSNITELILNISVVCGFKLSVWLLLKLYWTKATYPTQPYSSPYQASVKIVAVFEDICKIRIQTAGVKFAYLSQKRVKWHYNASAQFPDI